MQAGIATAQPKAGTGAIEMLRTLRVARQSAVKARTQAANQLHALVVTAPEPLPSQLRRLSVPRLVTTAVAFRPTMPLTTPTAATKLALKSIAVRYRQLNAEIAALDQHLDRLVAAAAPALVTVKGVGTDIAATLLTVAGDNPERLASEGAFAHLCGAAPIPASSGKITRYRLNRGGDRKANRALYLLAVGRMGWDPRTRQYVARRTTEGRSKPAIIRCLKRYIARELYPLLLATTSVLVEVDGLASGSAGARQAPTPVRRDGLPANHPASASAGDAPAGAESPIPSTHEAPSSAGSKAA